MGMTEAKRLETLEDQALAMNADLPTDIWLKGNGEIWIVTHGNIGITPRKATNEEIIKYLWTAIDAGNKMISV